MASSQTLDESADTSTSPCAGMTQDSNTTPTKAQGPRKKLTGYEFYRDVLGSPKYVVAPMVDQSELAFRMLVRRYGAQLVYTPMLNAKLFASSPKYRQDNFDTSTSSEEGGALDRPLIVQFCGNDPEILLKAARMVEDRCDAVDVNLGCPQDIARRGRYGCFLQDEWEVVFSMINTLHVNLSIPVTAKFRIFESVGKTVEYARMMERAGASMLACHGRVRGQRGGRTGLASHPHISAVKKAVSIPVLANGNVLFARDVGGCLERTGAEGVMCAEGVLYNPGLFWGVGMGMGVGMGRDSSGFGAGKGKDRIENENENSNSNSNDPKKNIKPESESESKSESESEEIYYINSTRYKSHVTLALEYLSIVRSLRTKTGLSAVKGHLFKMMRPALGLEVDLRGGLGGIRGGGGGGEGGKRKERDRDRDGDRDRDRDWRREDNGYGGVVGMYESLVGEVGGRMDIRIREAQKIYREKHNLSPEHVLPRTWAEEFVTVDEATGLEVLPVWIAQPYFRPLGEEAREIMEAVRGGLDEGREEEADGEDDDDDDVGAAVEVDAVGDEAGDKAKASSAEAVRVLDSIPIPVSVTAKRPLSSGDKDVDVDGRGVEEDGEEEEGEGGKRVKVEGGDGGVA